MRSIHRRPNPTLPKISTRNDRETASNALEISNLCLSIAGKASSGSRAAGAGESWVLRGLMGVTAIRGETIIREVEGFSRKL